MNLVVELSSSAFKKQFSPQEVKEKLRAIESQLSTYKDDSKTQYNWVEMMDEFSRMKKDNVFKKQTTGDLHLDNKVYFGFRPHEISILFGSTSMGKSAFAQHISLCLLRVQVPVLYVSLEMDFASMAGRYIASTLDVKLSNVYFTDVKLPFSTYEESPFSFVDNPSISLEDLKYTIEKFIQIHKPTDRFVVILDLMTLISNFSGKTAQEYEASMNKLHVIARETGAHIIGIVQAQRSADNMKPASPSLKDIQAMKPGLFNIKNSSAIAERARLIMSIFRPKYYLERYFER